MAILTRELELKGKPVFTIEEIRKNYSYSEILTYFKNNSLISVCKKDSEISENLRSIDKDLSDIELSMKLAAVFNITFDEEICKNELSASDTENNSTVDNLDPIFSNNKKKFFESMTDDIRNLDITEEEKNKILKNLLKIKEQKINILITGATGCGKSSTINALFDTEVAKVGVGVDPETMEIQKYELDSLVLWDSPGLGDGKEADQRHSANIIKKLNEIDSQGNLLIDLVLVILDGSTRDLGTSYDLINTVIMPNLGENKENRILVAINQADMAMKGRNWNEERNCPEPELTKFLEEKVISVKNRIKEGTGVDITPIYYTAGYKEEGQTQCKPFNLTKLLYYIINYTPEEKRLNLIQNISKNEDSWEHDDSNMETYENESNNNESNGTDNTDCSNYKNTNGKSGNNSNKTKQRQSTYKEEIKTTVRKTVEKSLGQKIVSAIKSAAKSVGSFFKGLFGRR